MNQRLIYEKLEALRTVQAAMHTEQITLLQRLSQLSAASREQAKRIDELLTEVAAIDFDGD